MNKDKEKEKERKRIEQEISDLEKQCRLLGVDVTQAVIGRPAFLNARSVGIEPTLTGLESVVQPLHQQLWLREAESNRYLSVMSAVIYR